MSLLRMKNGMNNFAILLSILIPSIMDMQEVGITDRKPDLSTHKGNQKAAMREAIEKQ